MKLYCNYKDGEKIKSYSTVGANDAPNMEFVVINISDADFERLKNNEIDIYIVDGSPVIKDSPLKLSEAKRNRIAELKEKITDATITYDEQKELLLLLLT